MTMNLVDSSLSPLLGLAFLLACSGACGGESPPTGSPDGGSASADAGFPSDAGDSLDAGFPSDAGDSLDAGPDDADAGLPDCPPMPTWYLDPDGDGYGDADDFVESCTRPEGYAPVAEAIASLSLDHDSLTLPKGTGARVIATFVLNSGRSENASDVVDWSSDAPAVVRVGTGAQLGGVVDALDVGQVVVRASYRGHEDSVAVDAIAAAIRDLRVTPARTTAVFGDLRGVFFKAFATYTDGVTVDVTEQARWTCPDDQIGSVGNVSVAEWEESELNGDFIEYRQKGHFRMGEFNYDVTPPAPLTAGVATISASLDDHLATALLVVTDATLATLYVQDVAPILLGSTVSLSARGAYDSGLRRPVGKEALWTSSHPELVQVTKTPDGEPFATALAPGAVTLTACVGEICGSTEAEVNARVLTELRIIADTPDMLLGTTTRMKAIAVFGDGLLQDVTGLDITEWTFSDPDDVAVAFDGQRGLAVFEGSFRNAYTVRGLREGLLSVTVSLATSPTTAVTTGALLSIRAPQLVSLAVTPEVVSAPVSDTTRLRAIGTFEDGSRRDVTAQALWLSDDPTIAFPADLDADGAVVSAISEGQTMLRATMGAFSASATVEALDAVQSIELIPVHPETLTAYEPPFQTGTFVQFIARATLESGAQRDLPLDGFQWEVPRSHDDDGTWVPLASVAPGLFRVVREMAASITATRVLDNGETYAASYAVHSEVYEPVELIVDPPNPAAVWNDNDLVPEQYFKVYARYPSGRLQDVTHEALEVRITLHDDVVFGASPESVAAPGEVVESTYWEFVELAPGFEADRSRFPDLSQTRDSTARTAVRRFDAPQDLKGRFDVSFTYDGLSRTATMALNPSRWNIAFDPDFEPSSFGSSATNRPERIVVTTMADLIIKDVDPTYSAALRMMEARARARAPTLDAASLEASFRANDATAGLSEHDLQTMLAQMTTALADPKMADRTALLVEFQLLLAMPKASRTAEERLAVAWLGKAVHDAGVISAEATLREYEKWAEDPWAYVPPPGIPYVTPAPQGSLVGLFDNPHPPDLLKVARAGIAPSLVAGSATGVLEVTLCATLTASTLVGGAAISSGFLATIHLLMPYAAIAAKGITGLSTTMIAASAGAAAIVVTAVVVSAIQSVQVIDRAALPRRLKEIVAEAKLASTPDADVLLLAPDGLTPLMGALIIKTY